MRDLARLGELRKFGKGRLLVREGEVSPAIVILLSGSVHAVAARSNGQAISFSSVRAGEAFGVITLDGGPWLASVVALEAVQCLVISRSKVLQYIDEHPEFTLELIMNAIQVTRRVTRVAKKMAFLNVYSRLRTYFNELAGMSPGYPLDLPGVTHRQIAAQIGASRVMVSRLLKDLEKGEFVEIKIRRIRLLRPLPLKW